tara:strand:+ start:390 stop:665 length:276 start_codon:yes stop_codon:yes gene_type:complete
MILPIKRKDNMNKVTLEEAIKSIDELLIIKQENGTIKNIAEESIFLCGAMAVIHQIYSTDVDTRMDSVPPRWIFSGIAGRSSNNFNYKEAV